VQKEKKEGQLSISSFANGKEKAHASNDHRLVTINAVNGRPLFVQYARIFGA
jgi:hypothetical protein